MKDNNYGDDNSGGKSDENKSNNDKNFIQSSNDQNADSSTTFVNQCFENDFGETGMEIKSNQQPQRSTSSFSELMKKPPPPRIDITNEDGKNLESINIDTNNNNLKNVLPSTPRELRFQLKQKLNSTGPNAVVVKNVSFSYSKKNNILSNIELTVPKGKIYALLGSSGCGKTTLLRLILGRIKPRKGTVKVFDAIPGGIYSNVPGKSVGYMPQELALFPTFTIYETFYYFGMLNHIPVKEIGEKTDFLVEFLNLPSRDRKVEQCSGGQQRRVSIAATLFHSPPLLIFDEPTVGVDPLLRLKIWEYLEYLCTTNNMTVMITTHYIEESRRASNLAFMRFGRILVQDSVDHLMSKYQCTVLEDIFLKLCQQDCGDIKIKYSTKKKVRPIEPSISNEPTQPVRMKPVRSKFHHFSIDLRHLKALFFKNYVNLKRNPLVFFFFLILPVIQIVLFCTSVHKLPDNLPIAIHNSDNQDFSNRYFNLIDNKTLHPKFYNSKEAAIQSVIDGKSWYAVLVENNFTEAYKRRAQNPAQIDDEDLESSKIKLYADNTDNFIQTSVYNSLVQSYQKFVAEIAKSFSYNPATVRLPINVKEIVYGQFIEDGGFDLLNVLSGGALVAIIYTTPLIMASFSIVLERKGFIIERTFVSGATALEVFITHLITMLLALVFQVLLLMIVALWFYEITLAGSPFEMFALIYLQGVSGILIGLFISSFAPNEIVALLLSFGMVFPVWMISGVFWPLESISYWFQKFCWIMPLSYPLRAIDHVMKRGWTYQYYEVQMAYGVSAGYGFFMLLANIVLFHFTSK